MKKFGFVEKDDDVFDIIVNEEVVIKDVTSLDLNRLSAIIECLKNMTEMDASKKLVHGMTVGLIDSVFKQYEVPGGESWKVPLIKAIRGEYGMGLKEAKEVAEDWHGKSKLAKIMIDF